MKRIQPYPVAVALSFIFVIFYLVCVGLHSFLPELMPMPMYRLWEMILFGFTWLTPLSLLIGIMEVFLGGFYVAFTLIPLYNYFNNRFSVQEGVEAMKPLRFKPVAFAVTTFGIITYVICITFDAVFPQWSMYKLWEILLPGFKWISWGSFFIGLIGIIVYGVYIAGVFVPIYNYFQVRKLPEVQ